MVNVLVVGAGAGVAVLFLLELVSAALGVLDEDFAHLRVLAVSLPFDTEFGPIISSFCCVYSSDHNCHILII